MIIWLKYSDNNRATTTYDYFQNAIEEYQCPLQVHRDKGTEIQMIIKHIIAIRADEIWGFISGKSTYNTGIKWLWRHYKTNVMTNFNDEFTSL